MLDDVESDFSRFHHIDDMYAMPSVKFFRFATRLVFYRGAVMAALQRLTAARAQEEEQAETPAPVPAVATGDVVVPPTRAALAVSDLGPLLSWG